ncbi:hypothetical protein H5410_035319 [Solanum commersonii]|uniref:F-box associated beta-propeller type 1 domain-containing protein n=1 Tax=Solanum commersonii TaxID=4109 RepID=A0A9J5Y2J6_SOLCO|nr:hypothetical protein H5410_035319 [Solanum commersonii]
MTLIFDPYFKMKHLNHARNDDNSQKILVHQWNPSINKVSLYCSSLPSVQQVEQLQKLDCPSNDKPRRHILYCCYDGLALMGIYNYLNKHLQLLLWNPSTRESMVLPYPKKIKKDYSTWGLGYDSTSVDYKILKIDHKSRNEIFALKSGSWRLTDKHPFDIRPILTSTNSLAFVHGAFHWLISLLMKCSMMSFSISDEVYREISLSEQLYSNFSKFACGVLVLREMLCDYVKESWTKLFTIQGTNIQLAIPKYMFSDGELLLYCIHLDRNYVFRTTSKGPFGSWPQSDVIQKGFVYTETQHNREKSIPFSAFWLRSSVVSVLISLISDMGKVHHGSLLSGSSIIAIVLHYNLGLVHPTNSIPKFRSFHLICNNILL